MASEVIHIDGGVLEGVFFFFSSYTPNSAQGW